MSRKATRKEAFILLYQMDIQKENPDYIINIFNEENPDNPEIDLNYIVDIVNGVFNKLDEIDTIIKENTIGWKLNRISKINKAVLRLAIYEIAYRDDIPISVSINEAVSLSKEYEGDESVNFINGVLGSIQKKYE